MTMSRPRTVLAAILGAAVIVGPLIPSDALAGRKKHRHPGCHLITVQSNYTVDTVTGCVRQGRRGPEVRLPSGAWIPCDFGCANTLRTQTIDFWQWIDENSRD